MKSFTILTMLSMLSTSLQNNISFENSLEETGSDVVMAFKKGSIEEYGAMLPTLAEFHQIMDVNTELYGSNIASAKQEFAARYQNEVVPSVKEAFKAVLVEGSQRGINWENIRFERIRNERKPRQENTTQLEIIFSQENKEYTLRIENAFVWQGRWRVTQFIRLI